MVSERLAQIFKALSDPSRLKIFQSLMLVSTALSISQISADYQMSRQGVTKHLKLLERASLISISQEGRERYCKANPANLEELAKWLKHYESFWNESLSNLSSYLDETDEA